MTWQFILLIIGIIILIIFLVYLSIWFGGKIDEGKNNYIEQK